MTLAENLLNEDPSWGNETYVVGHGNSLVPSWQKLTHAPSTPLTLFFTIHPTTNFGERGIRLGMPHPVNTPGTAAKYLENQKRQSLVDLLSPAATKMPRENEALEINEETRRSAILFIQQMLPNHVCPRIMPDGEGDLILFWGNPAVLMIAIDGADLHPTLRPGTGEARYLPTARIENGQIPNWIIKRVPEVDGASLSFA